MEEEIKGIKHNKSVVCPSSGCPLHPVSVVKISSIACSLTACGLWCHFEDLCMAGSSLWGKNELYRSGFSGAFASLSPSFNGKRLGRVFI